LIQMICECTPFLIVTGILAMMMRRK